MAVTVNIAASHKLAVKTPYPRVFELLSDVPGAARFFPGVDRLVHLGDSTYLWEMAKIGVSRFHWQTVYASKYVVDPAARTVVWTPVPGHGNALVSGHWKLVPHPHGTHLALNIHGVVTLPFPGIAKVLVVPAVQAEFAHMVQKYVDNLARHLEGRD